MARITLEGNTKDVRRLDGSTAYQEGEIRIRLFDGDIQDGMTLDAFELIVTQKKNWVMINSKFEIEGRKIAAREAYYDTDFIKLRDVTTPVSEERIYALDDSYIQAFCTVAVQTRLNTRERDLRRQNNKSGSPVSTDSANRKVS